MADVSPTCLIVQALGCVVPPAAEPFRDVDASSLALAGVDRAQNGAVSSDCLIAGAPMSSQVLENGGKKKRGRPPRNPLSSSSAVAAAAAKRSKYEEEDVCFVCFDGGSLVLCDRKECPKAYHPACVKRDEAYFRRNIRWTCGWHLCNICQRNAIFMCYTCPYSLCKGCVKQADILCVRGNKGFCRNCMSTIMLIEKVPQENKDMVQVDFDDTTSWEYLFKVYWVLLKEKEGLTIDELIRANNPWKVAAFENKDNFQLKNFETSNGNASDISSSCVHEKANVPKRMKTRKQLQSLGTDSLKANKVEGLEVSGLIGGPDWASTELLEFVGHMRNGDTAVVSQLDVQALLLDYIRKNNLRDPHRKCQIICDKRLENLFGKERVGHFEMLKLLEYHFKKESRTIGEIRSAAVAPLSEQAEEGTCGGIRNVNRENKRQSRRKAEDKDRQIKMASYAAIDTHNIKLIYLKRDLLESLMVDAEKFHDKVVGSVVRIKISSSDQKQEMHRLVRIIGTNRATDPGKVVDKVGNLTLKILNLNKNEEITVDKISDQDFSEDECRRLRQSIKLGLVERMTVGEIQDKAMTLQAVRVSDWIEAEIQRLNHLCDRASEMGHRKELRDYVEKIDLLKTPEERQRRACEIPEVHADPRMDPSYGSDDDSAESDMKQDGAWTPKYTKASNKALQLNFPVRFGDKSKIIGERALKTSAANGERKRKHSAEFGVKRAKGATASLEKTESHKSAFIFKEGNSRADSNAQPGDCDMGAIGVFSQATTDPSPAVSRGMLLVSDVSELDKIWHYRDPSGKVQGPFCMLQLRKWDSNRFFPSDLRVWKTSEDYHQSVLLTDALKQQRSSNESYVPQSSCLQSHDGDDGKVNSVTWTGSNYCGSSMDKAEGSNSNLTDIASTPEVNEQSGNGDSCQPDFDSLGGADQSSVQNFKTRLIDSLFNIEDPCPDAVSNRSPETADLDVKHVPSHPSSATGNGHVESETHTVKSDHPSSVAGGPGYGTRVPMVFNKTEISKLLGTVANTDDDIKVVIMESKLQDSANVCEDMGANGGNRTAAINMSEVTSPLPRTENKDSEKEHSPALVDYVLDVGAVDNVSGTNDVSLLPHTGENVENDSLNPPTAEGSHLFSSNVLVGDSSTNWSNVSCGMDVSPLASSRPDEDSSVSNEYTAAFTVPEQDPGASWSSISGGVSISELPNAPHPGTNCFKIPTSVMKEAADPSIPKQDSGISQNITPRGIGFSNMSADLDSYPSKGIAAGNNHCPLNVQGQDSVISWSEASSLVAGQVHLSNAVNVWDISRWQPIEIELSTLGDDSVSDLLSEVEAMESLKGMSSPTSRMNLGDDSIDSPGHDCFSPLGGLSPNIDPGTTDPLSSTADLGFQLHPNHMQHNLGDQPNGIFHGVISSPLRTITTLGSERQAEVKLAIPSVPNHMQPNYIDQPNRTLHDSMSTISCTLVTLGSEAEAEAKPLIPSVPNHGVCDIPKTSILCTVGLEVESEEKLAVASLPHHNFVSEAPLTSLTAPLAPPPHTPSPLPASKTLSPSPPQPPVPLTPQSKPPALSPQLPSTQPPQKSQPQQQPPSPSPSLRPTHSLPLSKVPSPSQPLLAAAAEIPLPPSPAVTAAKSHSLLPPAAAVPTKLHSPLPPPAVVPNKPHSPLPSPAAVVPNKPHSPLPPAAVASAKPHSSMLPPSANLKPRSPLLSHSEAAAKKPLTPPAPSPTLRLGNATLSLDCPSSSQEQGEAVPIKKPVHHQESDPLDQSQQAASMGHSWKQGSGNTSNGREPPGQPAAPDNKFSGTSSILGTPNIHWDRPGSVGPVTSAINHWSTAVANQGSRVSQTSPKFSHNTGRHPGTKDRSHNYHGVDSGFGKNRSTSWNRQSSFGGGGGSSRPHSHRGQRVCKFYESGYCKNGESCKYLHP